MRFSKAVVRGRVAILILTVILMIPAVFGMLETRINYDMLNYLPDDMDTVIGQNALLEDFGKGAFSFIVVENMPEKDVAALQEKLESVEHVETVLWYNSLMDTSIPMQLLPDKLYDAFNTGDATMMAVFFDTATSADETMDAIREIRSIAGKQCFVSGMSALVTDLKDLCEQEEPIYVAIAVVLACVAMMLFLDSWLIPFVFLASIGAAILLNLGITGGSPERIDRIKGDRSELVSTRVDDYLLVGAGGGSQYGTAYVGDAAHDFSDKTVYLTADLDMGGSSNWTPIGGLYPMDRDNTERVIVAYFNGTLDGQGHRITNLFCDRYAEKGYAYSQGVGLIGHMGDLYDGEAAPETAPAVRNLSVSGSIYGRRMVGGIVGRTGSIPTGIYLENCANHASVKNTDSKGVGGIVGAGWSEGAIVNCYNTGSVTTASICG